MNNKIEIWKELKKHCEEYPQNFAGNSNLEEIKKVEDTLDMTLSESYKKFLLLYAGASLEGLLIFGTKPHRFMGVTNNTVVLNTLNYRNQNWPGTENWYIVSDDGAGNPFGVDPEGKVWLSDHDTGEILPVAEDFEEFLYRLYTDTLWEDD